MDPPPATAPSPPAPSSSQPSSTAAGKKRKPKKKAAKKKKKDARKDTSKSGSTATAAADPSTNPASAEGSDVSKSKAKVKRITNEAKEALRDYYDEKKWARNVKFPGPNVDGGLDGIIKKFGLTRKQASLQLRNWKAETYDNSQVELIISPGQIESSIYNNMSMEVEEFVAAFMEKLYSQKETPGDADTTNLFLSFSMHNNHEGRKLAIKFIHNNPDFGCNKILASYVRAWTTIMAEEFPKKAQQLEDAEMVFLNRIEELHDDMIPLWKKLHGCIPSECKLSEEDFGHLGMFVVICLFTVWCRATVEDDMPEVVIPADDLIGKYSLPVVYYAAGWTLQRASLALTVSIDKRDKYQEFATSQSISKERAIQEGLPYTLVEIRQRRCLIFCSKGYFDFIKKVESTYIKNLTLTMMMAHCEGDLILAIDGAIKESKVIQNMFLSLFELGCDLETLDDEKKQYYLDIMVFVLDRYRRMRGCWFVKYLKGSQGKSMGDQILENAPTRTRVAHLAAKSKAVAESKNKPSKEEQELWDQAESNVLTFEEEMEKEDDANEDESDSHSI